MGIDINQITLDLFKELEYKSIRYCVYNGYEKLPYKVETDLDIAIEERGLEKLDTILFTVAAKNGLLLLSKIWHDNKKISYIITPTTLEFSESLQFDFFSEFLF